MAVPDFQSFFKPLLDVAADGREHSMKEAREEITKSMTLLEEDMREPLPSGMQTKFDTTGKFSDDAKGYVETIDPKVILIDGRTLAELMIDHGLGTTTTATYQVKRIDSDYFTEE